MQTQDMKRLIAKHLEGEAAGDPERAVSVFTDDVVHDTVGLPGGPIEGKPHAKAFYEQLVKDINTEEMHPIHEYFGPEFAVIEHQWRGTVPGTVLGVPGHGKRIAFRILHVWEFRDGRISRENIWLDGGSIVAQLTGS